MFLTSARRLTDVKITASDQDELMLLYMARNLYLSDEDKVNKDKELQLVRNFKDNYDNGEDDEQMRSLKEELTQYIDDLQVAGIKDWELKTLEVSLFWNIVQLMRSLIFVLSFFSLVSFC